jgi:hypothetical protein
MTRNLEVTIKLVYRCSTEQYLLLGWLSDNVVCCYTRGLKLKKFTWSGNLGIDYTAVMQLL